LGTIHSPDSFLHTFAIEMPEVSGTFTKLSALAVHLKNRTSPVRLRKGAFMGTKPQRRFVFVLLPLTGCSHAVLSPYSTIAEPPPRDSLAAVEANRRGLEAVEKHDMSRAEAAFREALSLDIACAPAHNNLGLVFLQQKRWYEASWEFAYAAKLEPQASAPKAN